MTLINAQGGRIPVSVASLILARSKAIPTILLPSAQSREHGFPGSGGRGWTGPDHRFHLGERMFVILIAAGVVLASISSGLGEITFLALTSFFDR